MLAVRVGKSHTPVRLRADHFLLANNGCSLVSLFTCSHTTRARRGSEEHEKEQEERKERLYLSLKTYKVRAN